MKKEIKQWLKSKKETIKFSLTCPDQLFKACEAAGISIDYDNNPMQTNGWQWDYWQEGIYKNQKVEISGSGFYGWGQIDKIEE